MTNNNNGTGSIRSSIVNDQPDIFEDLDYNIEDFNYENDKPEKKSIYDQLVANAATSYTTTTKQVDIFEDLIFKNEIETEDKIFVKTGNGIVMKGK